MRNPNRIEPFLAELGKVWEEHQDLRFGQLMVNVLGKMQSEGRDPFFPEEDEMLEYFRNYFKKEN